MKSKLTDEFIESYSKLPKQVHVQARKAYQLWKDNPYHPGLHFKRIHSVEPLYSVRVGKKWRVLGYLEEDTITWF